MLWIRDILGWIRIRGSMPRHWPSRCQQKTNFLTQFFLLTVLLFEGTFTVHHFSKIKSQKESQNSRNQGFSYYFCMMIEGSGSGSIPLTSGSGSGSGRPKNMWIRWIRIRIRIRNTGKYCITDRTTYFNSLKQLNNLHRTLYCIVYSRYAVYIIIKLHM